ncbi:hypothetical protein ACOSQ2_030831 [Xanthoceras sorbifolium]
MDLELLRALKCGNGDLIMELAKEKPDVFSGRSPQGNTALHIASRSSVNKSVVQEILNKHPSLLYEKNDRGETPLHIAAAAGHLNVNIPMRMQDNEGNTPLHIAVRYGHLKIVEELTAVDPEPIIYINRAGHSPLSIAIDEKLTDIARWIIREYPDSLNYEGSNYQLTLLHNAVIRQNFDIMTEILKEKKEFVFKVNGHQMNALHYAAALGHFKISGQLLKEDVSLVYKCDKDGQTPIHLATKNGRFGVMKMLLKDYPDVIELLDNKKRNILHLAAECGHDDIVSIILNLPEKDDLMNAPDVDGNTPLHLAAMYFRWNVINILSRYGKLNIRATNHKLQTAIAIAQTSEMEAMENKKNLTLKALEAIYKNRDPDPEDIIANWSLDERIRVTDEGEIKRANPEEANRASDEGISVRDEGEIKRAKKLAEVLLTLTTLVAAFTFNTALTIPANYRYKGPNSYKFFNYNHQGIGFGLFTITIAMSSASCLSAAAIICWLFWRASNNHEFFIKTLHFVAVLTLLGLASMAVAFVSGLYLVLSNNETIPTWLVWNVCAFAVLFYVSLPISISFAEIMNRSAVRRIISSW